MERELPKSLPETRSREKEKRRDREKEERRERERKKETKKQRKREKRKREQRRTRSIRNMWCTCLFGVVCANSTMDALSLFLSFCLFGVVCVLCVMSHIANSCNFLSVSSCSRHLFSCGINPERPNSSLLTSALDRLAIP